MIEHTEKQVTEQKREPVRGKGRGFQSMTPEKRSAVARLGGRAAHALGTAHKWTSEEAQAAGRIGGARSRRGRKLTPEELQERRQRIISGEL